MMDKLNDEFLTLSVQQIQNILSLQSCTYQELGCLLFRAGVLSFFPNTFISFSVFKRRVLLKFTAALSCLLPCLLVSMLTAV